MIIHRPVKNYKSYIYEQGGKARNSAAKFISMKEKRAQEFIPIFEIIVPHMNISGSILCLGARAGGEVIAARRIGFPESIGVDLHPLDERVIKADWHEMPFKDSSFSNIFTNSLDHCADIFKLSAEIKRVLNKKGKFAFSATDRSSLLYERWAKKPNSEYLFWANPDDLRDTFRDAGFNPIFQARFGRDVLYVMGIKK
jgi:SAM-dependent methyltransferase